MPALSPRCETAVSQLPRWPMVSLTWSSAKAGCRARKVAATARASRKRGARELLACIAWVISLSRCCFAAVSFLLGAAQHGGGRDRGIAGLHAHVHDGHLAALDGRDRLREGRDQLARLGDRAEALRALRAGERRNVD